MYIELKHARINRGYTQEQMAELLGLRTRNAYALKENGQRGFEVQEALVIARELGESVEALFSFPSSKQNGYYSV